VEDAVRSALESPLLNDFDLKTAKNVLLNITVARSGQGMKMKQLEEINKLVNEYTGSANNFKSGIVFNDDPEFGDRVKITVIATGFKMSMISEISDNTGNYIMIDSNYTYRKNAAINSKEGIELPEVRTLKIGYNKNDVRKKICFEDGVKPILLVGEGVDRSELENTAAIRRKSGSGERRE
jgi:cell division protein FtsZ